jgi:hypothetical protein
MGETRATRSEEESWDELGAVVKSRVTGIRYWLRSKKVLRHWLDIWEETEINERLDVIEVEAVGWWADWTFVWGIKEKSIREVRNKEGRS